MRRTADAGSVTAELAVALPALVLLLLAALGTVDAVTTRMRCVDAARDAALAQARGGSGVAAGTRAAPAGATVTVNADGDLVRATVVVRRNPLGAALPGVTVEADAVAALEPGEPAP